MKNNAKRNKTNVVRKNLRTLEKINGFVCAGGSFISMVIAIMLGFVGSDHHKAAAVAIVLIALYYINTFILYHFRDDNEK